MTDAPMPPEDSPAPRRRAVPRLLYRAVIVLVMIATVLAIWAINLLLTDRFTETLRNRAEVRLALYGGNLQSELQRSAVVPLLLSRDPELIGALQEGEFAQTSQRLISLQSEIGAASLQLLDAEGRTVAATDRNQIGAVQAAEPFFVEARRTRETVFTTGERGSGGYEFAFSRSVVAGNQFLGVVVVGVDLVKFERSWSGLADAISVTDSDNRVVLATEPRWRGRILDEALAAQDDRSAWQLGLQRAVDLIQPSADAYVRGEAVLRSEARIPFRGWKLVSFTRQDSVRERVNGVLSLVIMGFALLLALAFWFTSRRARTRLRFIQRESVELRVLNARLQREIAERKKVQANLAVAEQTLAQSSKLAALGEMSAAVSHELNQPLAAMKTYLAGARLLLQRRRPDEALSSFQRIDDLIERMGSITRQLKSFARKGGDAVEPVDLRSCVSGALTMMEPQLKARRIAMGLALPPAPAMVMADRIRLEQVIINLLRNALDATKAQDDAAVEILVTGGDVVTLQVRDNGPGIRDLDKLFEPFHTTKGPGEGVGLGLAISSGIVADLGGRLTAHNASDAGGAVFEVSLPGLGADPGAAPVMDGGHDQSAVPPRAGLAAE